jgi:hypothetical protein
MEPTNRNPVSVAAMVDFQRSIIANERRAIVRFLRRRIEAGPCDVSELLDAIDAGAHHYDGELFRSDEPCQPLTLAVSRARSRTSAGS